MRLVSFGDVTFPQLNARQKLPVMFRSAVVGLRGGGFDQDGVNTYQETKMLSWNFWVTPDDGTVDTIIDNIYQEAGKGRRLLVATMRDGSQRQQFVKLISADTSPDTSVYVPSTLSSEGREVMQCQFEMVYPYWEHSSDAHLLLDTGLVLDDGLFLDAGNYTTLVMNSGSPTTKTITNSGNTKTDKFTLSFTGSVDGGFSATVVITGITIKNNTTGQELYWAGTFTGGDSLFINSLAQSIIYNGANAWADTTLGSNQIGFFTLALGANEFEFIFDYDNFGLSGTSITARWDWTRHYIR